MMKYLCNGIEVHEDYFLEMTCNAGVSIPDIKNMFDGYSFTGRDGNIYEIEEE